MKWSCYQCPFLSFINDAALQNVKRLRIKDADESVRDQFMVQSLINKSIKWIKQSFFILICLQKMCCQNLSISLYNGVCGSYVQIDFKHVVDLTFKSWIVSLYLIHY